MSAPTLAVGFTGSHYHHSETTTFSPPPSATGLSKPPHLKIPTSPSSSTPSQLRSTPTLVLPINSVDCLLLESVVVAVAARSCLLRRISTDRRHPHDPKGLPEEEKIIPSTDSFFPSTFASPGCQSLVPLSPATNRSVSLGTDPRCDLIPPPSPDLGRIIPIFLETHSYWSCSLLHLQLHRFISSLFSLASDISEIILIFESRLRYDPVPTNPACTLVLKAPRLWI